MNRMHNSSNVLDAHARPFTRAIVVPYKQDALKYGRGRRPDAADGGPIVTGYRGRVPT